MSLADASSVPYIPAADIPRARRRQGGQVTIDRGLLDELRAEVTQVKASLLGQKP